MAKGGGFWLAIQMRSLASTGAFASPKWFVMRIRWRLLVADEVEAAAY